MEAPGGETLGMRTVERLTAFVVAGLLLAPTVGAAPGSTGDSVHEAGQTPEHVQGVDVSHYSGAIDWGRVRDAGYSFAYVKATEGVDDADPSFATHWEELAAAGLHRGAYHFYVTEDDPEEQARFFLSVAKLGPGDLPPAVDIEVLGHGTKPGLAERVRTFLETLERETGTRPIIYTGPKFWNAHLGEGFADYPLWLAEYGTSEPTVPEGWERWTLWQWQGEAAVPGVEKDADVSRLHPELGLLELRIPVRE